MSRPPVLDADAGRATEQDRQNLLLHALGSAVPIPALARAAVESPERVVAAVQAYRSNAHAAAERALAASFPVLRALVADESFAAIARAYRHACPAQRGDLARLGEELPAFIDADPLLADVPYLGDVARLELALARAESAADARLDASTLERLATLDPAGAAIDLAPGCDIVTSRWPIATIWAAHQPGGDLAAASAALARCRPETAFVRRNGWRACCEALDDADARFTSALLEGRSIAAALDAAGDAFRFDEWLARAIRDGWLVAVRERRITP